MIQVIYSINHESDIIELWRWIIIRTDENERFIQHGRLCQRSETWGRHQVNISSLAERHTSFNPLRPHDALNHHIIISEKRLDFPTTKGFSREIAMKLLYQFMAIFVNFSPTSSHFHPLQVENCGSNSRLVVDEDDNGKFRLEKVYPYSAEIFLFKPWRPKGFFENVINVLVSFSGLFEYICYGSTDLINISIL